MPEERFEERLWLKPLVISVVFHAVLFVILYLIPGANMVSPEHQTRTFRVKGVAHLPMIPGNPGGGGLRRPARTMQFAKPSASAAPSPKDVRIEPLLDRSPVRQNEFEVEPKKPELVGSTIAARDFETILARTDERQLKEKIQANRQSTEGSPIDKLLARSGAAKVQEFVHSLGKPMAGLAPPVSSLAIDPEEGMPGFTPVGSGGGGGGGTGSGSPGGDPNGIDGKIGEAREAITPYESLDRFLDIDLTTYTDPSDKQKYFMVKIFARKDARFKVMPKELLFVVDCSLSITPDRLEEFKKGIRQSLQELNEGDVFNVVAFRDKPEFFSSKSIAAEPAAIDRAEKFVASLTSNQRTDVYQAIADIVKTPLARRPSNLILISDGRPTHGVVDDRELLSAITRTNRGVRPVFAFTGGRRVNRYLLDFIAYQNRAWAEYIKRTPQIAEGLAAFNRKIKDPIFLNLRYELTAVDEDEVYPKSLPDFYRNAEFTLYGTYDKESDFSMQLLGDIDGQTKQLVFTRSFADAKKGNEDVLRGWAFNKVYHLISRLNVEKKPETLAEIERLSKRYGITTPYSPELLKQD